MIEHVYAPLLPLLKDDEHDPYINLLEYILNGRYGMEPMTPERRIAWMRAQLPRTYALLANGHRWAEVSDI